MEAPPLRSSRPFPRHFERHDALVDVFAAKQMTFTGTREELRERLAQLEARGATGIIFGTSGYDVERELRAYAEVAGLR